MVNSKPPRGLRLNLAEANNGARAARMTGESGPQRWEKGSAGIGLRAAVHQVDSRAAAVNTNNGEYRSVNCVLGSIEGGCAAVLLPSPVRARHSVPSSSLYPWSSRIFFPLPLPPPRGPTIATHLTAIVTHMCLLADRSTRYARCQTRAYGGSEIVIPI